MSRPVPTPVVLSLATNVVLPYIDWPQSTAMLSWLSPGASLDIGAARAALFKRLPAVKVFAETHLANGTGRVDLLVAGLQQFGETISIDFTTDEAASGSVT